MKRLLPIGALALSPHIGTPLEPAVAHLGNGYGSLHTSGSYSACRLRLHPPSCPVL